MSVNSFLCGVAMECWVLVVMDYGLSFDEVLKFFIISWGLSISLLCECEDCASNGEYMVQSCGVVLNGDLFFVVFLHYMNAWDSVMSWWHLLICVSISFFMFRSSRMDGHVLWCIPLFLFSWSFVVLFVVSFIMICACSGLVKANLCNLCLGDVSWAYETLLGVIVVSKRELVCV